MKFRGIMAYNQRQGISWLRIECLVISMFLLGCFQSFAEKQYWNKGRSYKPFTYASSEGILIDNPTDSLRYDYHELKKPTKDFYLHFRSKNINGRPARKYPYKTREGKIVSINNPHWGFFLTGLRDTLAVTVKAGEVATAMEPEPCLEINLYSLGLKTKESACVIKKINPYDGENLWSLSVENGKLSLSGGNTEINPIASIPWTTDITGFGFLSGWAGQILVSDIEIEYDSKEESRHQPFSVDEMNEYLDSADDPMEGYWTVFDRELEESLLKMGGDYILASLKQGDDYYFFYLEGASINSQNWKSGDLKAILSPSPFSGIYNVEWIDAMKSPINRDIKAQRGEGETLTLQFPYQSSKLRLRKLPK